jgi:uncharacterized repeat protein (TIGR01451 family)
MTHTLAPRRRSPALPAPGWSFKAFLVALVATTMTLGPAATAFATETTPVPSPGVAASSTDGDAATEESLEQASAGEAATSDDGEVTTTAVPGEGDSTDSTHSEPAQLADTGQAEVAKAGEANVASRQSTTQTQSTQDVGSSSSDAQISVTDCVVSSSKQISNIEFFTGTSSLAKDESSNSTTFDLTTFSDIEKVKRIMVKSGTTSKEFDVDCGATDSTSGDKTDGDNTDGDNTGSGNNNNDNNNGGGSHAPAKNDGTNGNGGGANSGDCAYVPDEEVPEHEPGTGKPDDGSVGNADDKCPPGQEPDGSDPNKGYECDENNGVGKGNPAHTGCDEETETEPSPLTIAVDKTNDADRDGNFSEPETADLRGQNVDFQAVITNDSAVPVVIRSITDSFDGQTINVACDEQLLHTQIASGDSVTCTFTVNNYAPSTADAEKRNTVRVVVSELGLPDNRKSARDDSTVLGPDQVDDNPDLAVDKSGPATGLASGTGTYEIAVENVGSQPVTERIRVTDELPDGERATSVTEDGFDCTITEGGRLVTCFTDEDLDAGDASGVILVEVTYAADADGTLTDTARVVPVNNETNLDNNEDTVDTVIDAPVVQGVTFCHATGSATNPFNVITTSVNAIVSNGGHAEHQGGRDVIPAFTYLDRNGEQQTFPGQNLGEDGVFDIKEDCEVAVLPEPPADKPDLAVDKSGPASGVSGGTGTYTIVVKNVGIAAVTDDIIVTDTLPEGETATSVPSSPGFRCVITNDGATVTCRRSEDLAAGASTAPIEVAVSYAADAEGALTDVARVVPVEGETNTSNNRDEVTTTIPEAPVLDLAVAKTDEGASAVPGGTINYTVTVRNVGNQPISDFTVAELPETGLTVTAINGGADFNCTPSGCTYVGATLQPNQFRQLSVTAVVGETAPDQAVNVVEINAPGDDNDANDRDEEITPVDDDAVTDVRILKTDAGASAVRGGTVTYTATVTNVGNQPVSAFTVTEQPEEGLTVTDIDGPAGLSCDALVCTYDGAALLPGQATQLIVTASVASAAPDTVTNVVEVDAPGDDNDTNDRDDEDTPVVVRDLRIVKVDDVDADAGESIEPGDDFDYTIRVVNDGSTSVADFVVSDTLPTELTLNGTITADGAGFDCQGTRPLDCTYLGSLAPGEDVTLTVPVILSEDYDGVTVVNTATVPLVGDPTPANNTDTETTPVTGVLPEPPAEVLDLRIVKTDDVAANESLAPGDVLTYDLEVFNDGGGAVSGFVVTDALPTGLTLRSIGGDDFECDGLVCTFQDSLPVGESATVTVVTEVNENFGEGSLVNTATVTTPPGDPTPENNTDTETTPVVEVKPEEPTDRPDVAIVKDDAGATVKPGGQLTYTLTVTNEGPSAVSSIRVTDTLPGDLTLDSVDAPGFGCATSARALDCTYIRSLAPNATAVITVVTTLSSSFTGDAVSNTAVVHPLPNETDRGDNTSTETTDVVDVQDAVFDRPAPPAEVDAQAGELPFTGSSTDNLLAMAALLLLLGVAAQLAGRRRRAQAYGYTA